MSEVTPPRPSPVRRQRSRDVKRAAVLSATRAKQRLSRVEPSELTGLSAATLTSLVRDLIAEGYLVEKGVAASRSGRPRTILEFDPRVELVAAVSLAPDGLSCRIADGYGDVVASARHVLGGDVVDTIASAVETLAGDQFMHLRGVAVAVPGVSFKGKVRLAPHVGVVEKRSVGEQLSSQLRVPVVVDNDVNLMVVGEHSAGAARGADDVMLFHFAEGVGAGLVLDGSVRRGSSGGAGEVGFFPTFSGAGQGGIGGFEARWSTTAIAAVLAEAGYAPVNESPVATLVSAADENADLARYREMVLTAWGRLIVSCICVVDPGLVLLSGSATDLDVHSLASLDSIVQEGAPSPTQVRLAELGGDAVLHGAVSSALSAAGLLARPVT